MARQCRIPAVAALAVLAAATAAGCGADAERPATTPGPTPDQQVRTVVATFGIATQQKDYRKICDQLLSTDLVARIEDAGLPCEGALQRGLGGVRSPTLEITDVSIEQDRALVSVHTTAQGQPSSDDALQLVKENGSWRIASLDDPSGTGTATTTTPRTTTTPPATTSRARTYPNGDD